MDSISQKVFFCRFDLALQLLFLFMSRQNVNKIYMNYFYFVTSVVQKYDTPVASDDSYNQLSNQVAQEIIH